MPFVLTTDNGTDGTAYWAPASPGGLEFWSENPQGDLYPNVDGTQDLGLAGNRVDQIFGQRVTLASGIAGGAVLNNAGVLAGGAFGVDAGIQNQVGAMVGGFAYNGGGQSARVYAGTWNTPGLFDGSVALGSVIAAAGNRGTISSTGSAMALGTALANTANAEVVAAYRSIAFGAVTGTTANAEIRSLDGSLAFGGVASGSVLADYASLAFGRTTAPIVGPASITARYNSLAFGQVTGSGRIGDNYAYSALTFGEVRNNGRISSDGGAGTLAFGWAQDTGSWIQANGVGSQCFGLAQDYGTIRANNQGLARGSSDQYSDLQALGVGSHAGGRAYSYSTIRAAGEGSTAFGRATYDGQVQAVGSASLAFGYADTSGTIEANGTGSFAGGSSVSGVIVASRGAFAFGIAYNGTLSAAGVASFAVGYAYGPGSIVAQSSGSFAFGDAFAGGGEIRAGAINSAQFFTGTNLLGTSFKVGGDVFGLRLIGNNTASTRVGDFWTDGVDVFVRTGGVTKSLSAIP